MYQKIAYIYHLYEKNMSKTFETDIFLFIYVNEKYLSQNVFLFTDVCHESVVV